MPPGIEPYPDDTHVFFNDVVGNGSASSLAGIAGANLLWIGSGTDNSWFSSSFETNVPGVLPGGG